MSFDRNKPYNVLPELPPEANIETKAILKRCINAGRALAELKTAGELIPNQAVLINTIPILEANASSEIENIVTTTDSLFRYSSAEREARDPAVKETLRYRTALYEGYKSLDKRPVCTATAVSVCRTLRNIEIDIRKVPGTAIAGQVSGGIIYTPPEGENVIREKLANWEKFINESEEFDPLIRLAVMHYQFEAIHPFTDGNGRTGRILNILFLVQQDLLGIPVLYLSRFIIDNKTRYYSLLRNVTEEGEWEPWILFILEAIEDTSRWMVAKIRAISRLLGYTCNYVQNRLPKIYSRELVEMIFTQPYCRIANLVEAGIVRRQTASSYLKALVDIGVLREFKTGREKIFLHPKFFNLLTGDDNSFTEYPKAE
jgi:Fic family protein